MSETLDAKYIVAEETLIGLLDLCGTTAMYEKLDLEKQVDRITHVVGNVWTELSNVFGAGQKSLYVHMFGDSVVIAQRHRKDLHGYLSNLVRYFLTLQFQMFRYKPPTLCRCMVRKGKYYGIRFDHETNIDGAAMNFSLVGGPTIVDMDKELKGLPAGVYIDRSLASEYKDSNKLVPVDADRLVFVKPPDNFLSFEEIFGNHDLDQWVAELIEASDDRGEFASKIKPWADAVAGRSTVIRRTCS